MQLDFTLQQPRLPKPKAMASVKKPPQVDIEMVESSDEESILSEALSDPEWKALIPENRIKIEGAKAKSMCRKPKGPGRFNITIRNHTLKVAPTSTYRPSSKKTVGTYKGKSYTNWWHMDGNDSNWWHMDGNDSNGWHMDGKDSNGWHKDGNDSDGWHKDGKDGKDGNDDPDFS